MGEGYSHAVILDFEATCDRLVPLRPREIIEFPSVLLSLSTRQEVDEFESFVRPHHNPVLTEFCIELTHIRQADVDGADLFPEVLRAHRAWLDRHGLDEKNALIVTCGDWDLGTMFPAQCAVAVPPIEDLPPIYVRWQNLKRAFCQVTGRPKASGMAGMLRELNLPLQGKQHRGIDDCRNLARLFLALLERGAAVGATSFLPGTRYPPLTLVLRHDDRVERTQLKKRSLSALTKLAGRLFKRQFSKFRRRDGSILSGDRDLLRIRSGEEITVS